MDVEAPWRAPDGDSEVPNPGAGERFFQAFIESMRDVAWVLDVETLNFVYVSPSVAALRGYTPAEIMAEPMDAALTPEASAYVRGLMKGEVAEIIAGTRSIDVFNVEEVEQPCKDGSTVWTEVVARYHRDNATGRFQVWGVTRDITQRRRVEEKLLLLAENATDVVLRLDVDHRVLWVSQTVTGLLGWDPEELVGRSIVDLVHPDDMPGAWAVVSAAIDAGEASTQVNVRYAQSDGGWRWVSASIRLLRDKDHKLVGMVDAIRDIHHEVEAREALERSERRFRVAMAQAPQGMAILNLEARFDEVNPALCRILETPRDELIGQELVTFVQPDERSSWTAAIDDLLNGGHEHVTRESRFLRGDGAEIWVQHALALLRDADGSAVSFVSQFQDVTDARRAFEHLAHQASHDRLTGLLSRGEFFQRLESTLSHEPRAGDRVGVLFCDVDDLKGVNDRLGHGAGDLLLVTVGQAIRSAVRTTDFVGRIGGDEFVVVLTGLRGEADAVRLAEKLRGCVADPLDYDGHEISPTLSIGLAMADPPVASEDVIRRADLAVYAAKAAGRDCVVVYSPELDAWRKRSGAG